MNVYKGLPISYDAQINSVGDSEIEVHSNRNQLACLYYQRETYLQGNGLPSVLRSQVVSLHLRGENATLTNIEAAQERVGNRTQIRVEPEESLIALLQFNGAPMGLTAPIADISAEGAAVHLEPYMYSPRLCRPGNQVSINISLPDSISQKLIRQSRDGRNTGALHFDASSRSPGAVTITTTGTVTSVRFERIRYRVGMRLFFKDLSRTVILQYISQRQSEIIRDLSLLSDELYSRKK